MAKRYVTSEHVEHGCCYDVCVVDTDNDSIVAECVDEDVAVMLADLLNATGGYDA